MQKSYLLFISIVVFICFFFSISCAENGQNFQFKKNPQIQQIKPKKPVKIKLKRLAEGKYTWDLTGDDVDEIVRADKRLKKLLNIE